MSPFQSSQIVVAPLFTMYPHPGYVGCVAICSATSGRPFYSVRISHCAPTSPVPTCPLLSVSILLINASNTFCLLSGGARPNASGNNAPSESIVTVSTHVRIEEFFIGSPSLISSAVLVVFRSVGLFADESSEASHLPVHPIKISRRQRVPSVCGRDPGSGSISDLQEERTSRHTCLSGSSRLKNPRMCIDPLLHRCIIFFNHAQICILVVQH